ncbi:MAG: hypothetical protein WCQ77_06330 [Planctomycetota bacterium]
MSRKISTGLFVIAKRCLVSLLVFLWTLPAAMAAPAPPSTGPNLTVGLKATDIDFAACKAWVDGEEAQGDFKNGILATLGVAAGNPWAASHSTRQQEAKVIQYLVVLKRPVKFGSLLFQKEGHLAYLKPGKALPADPAKADDWIDVTFPPNQSGWRLATVGGESQAFLCTVENTRYDWYRFTCLRIMKPRLHNIVPAGVANGEAEYVLYGQFGPPTFFKASNIIAGNGNWQSHGPDKTTDRVPRPPVSDIDPTWFVVSWDEPQAITGILLDSNFVKFKVYAYKGTAGINPAVAGPQDWTRIRQEPRADSNAALLTFSPITTRGLRFVSEATKTAYQTDRCGSIAGLQVFTDLEDAPMPKFQALGEAPPLAIKLNLPEKGVVSMAIDGADGLRARNFPARLEMATGEQTVAWDLKDDAGSIVPPGSYTWKAIADPGLQLKYELTPYPNVAMVAKDNSPWLNGGSGPGGWLADHTPPRAVCAAGDDRVFLGSPVCESGVAVIECDLEGRKRWGYGNIIAWTGPTFLASDGKDLYAMPQSQGHYALQGQLDYVWRFTLPEKKLDTPFELHATASRQRGVSGLAIRDGKLSIAVNAGENWLENAFAASVVDQDNCEPKYPKPPKTNKPEDPDRRADFLRLLRLTGTPPGTNGLTYLETAKQPAARQHIVIALENEVSIGSFVFPLPETKDLQMIISVLKPGATYPPNPNKEADWVRVYAGTGKGWTVVPTPEKTATRGIRLSFDMGLDELDEVLLGDEGTTASGDSLLVGGGSAADKGKAAWLAQLEGMKILRRRFENLFPSCKVTVNSGTVTPQGEWEANREKPLTTENPGLYMMEWPAAQPVRGLAIKEIDGRFTEIDAWTGEGSPDLKADAGWEKLTTFEQTLRYYYNPDQNHNSVARYLDGYVDFGREVKTRAIRLRVTEQWMWKEDGRAGVVGVRRDRGGMTLAPTRCRIYGVAPLKALGGEPPVDILATQRIEVYDLATKKLEREIPFPNGSDLAFAPDGSLYGISAGKVVKVDVEGGRPVPLALDVQRPTAITFDNAGKLFVFDSAADQRVIRVFDTAGKPLRTIGTPGGRIMGPYDPTRFTSSPDVAVDLAVDGKDQLWVVECDWAPKRVSIWGADGTFKKDLLGNTAYGGGGCLDSSDKSRLYYANSVHGGSAKVASTLEFALDWKTGVTALKNMLWLGNAPGGEQSIQLEDRLYLVTRPMFMGQPAGVVYLREKDHLKCVAAIGAAGSFPLLRTPAILEKLGPKALGDVEFMWSDRSGDGGPQPDEVEFFDLPDKRAAAVGRFDEMLGNDSPQFRYEVKEILDNGAPVYERKQKPFDSRVVRMNDGRFFVVGDNTRMAAVDAVGKAVWTHPVEGWGGQAITTAKTPWYPGQAVAQFDVIGHETTTAGDLGEFFVTNTNCGTWHVWTADGLLAGRIFQDLLGPEKKPWSMMDHERRLDLTGVTLSQEHFSGAFCKTREDGKFYAVAGHNHVSVVEVQGFEKFKRLGGSLTVTQQDVDAAMEWDRRMQSRRLYESAKMIECRRRKGQLTLDGKPDDWDFTSAALDGRDASLAMAYDDANLYVCFTVRGAGPLANTGNDWHRLFKTGAAVDLQIGVDPKADAKRTSPAVGDTRLLMTLAGKEPTAVVYQPNKSGAKPEEAWESVTGVARSSFDRVAKLAEVRMVARGDENGYCAEAIIPLQSLGFEIVPDLAYKFDWGILVSGPDGSEVIERRYWANPQTAILADEAIESQLHPDLWGTVRFSATADRKGQPELDMEKKLGGELEDDFDLEEE